MRSELFSRAPSLSDMTARTAAIQRLAGDHVVLLGAGDYSAEVRAFLASRGIDVAATVVDDDYLPAVNQPEHPLTFSELADNFEKYSLVVAFVGDPTKVRRSVEARRLSGLRSIAIIDCIRWQTFDEWRSDTIGTIAALASLYDALADQTSRDVLVAFLTSKLLLDPSGLVSVRSAQQYFPMDLPGFAPQPSDVFVDGGAFTGDTLADFHAHLPGGCHEYLAFEPDRENCLRLNDAVKRQGLAWVTVFPMGLWSTSGSIPFAEAEESTSHFDPQGPGDPVEVVALDSLDVPVTAIKLDVEGAEEASLTGASATIADCGPRLAIAAYHRVWDLTRLPALIESLRGDYRFALRFHGTYSEEMVLYAECGGS